MELPKPRSAWLLVVDEASLYPHEELRMMYREYHTTQNPFYFTCSPRIERGDLLFLYYMKPIKAIHFVTRADSSPYKPDSEAVIYANRDINPNQWLVNVTPLVEIEPISFQTVCQKAGGLLNLKGQTGKYIRPEAANALLSQASVTFCKSSKSVRETLQKVVGRAELPHPKKMTLQQWGEIPSALIRLEKEVERFLVEPLLRLMGVTRTTYNVKKQVRLGQKIADYVIYCGCKPICVIEAKQRAILPPPIDFRGTSKDFAQVFYYSKNLGTPSILIDCESIFLIGQASPRLRAKIERRNVRPEDLKLIKNHLTSKRSNQ